jgi:LysM repeat protein
MPDFNPFDMDGDGDVDGIDFLGFDYLMQHGPGDTQSDPCAILLGLGAGLFALFGCVASLWYVLDPHGRLCGLVGGAFAVSLVGLVFLARASKSRSPGGAGALPRELPRAGEAAPATKREEAATQTKWTPSVVIGVVFGLAFTGMVLFFGLMAALGAQGSSNSGTTADTAQTFRTPSPPATPTAVPPPADTPTPSPSYLTYTVQSGDTLSRIATDFGTTYQAIMELNHLTDTTIYSGTQLIIPAQPTTDFPIPTPASLATATLYSTPTPIVAPTSPPPAPTTPPDSGLGTSANPVPRGQAGLAPDGFQVVVLDLNPHAWPVVQAENMFNDPPGTGNRMVIVRVAITNAASAERKWVSASDFRLVGSQNVPYTTYGLSSSCGVVPDELLEGLKRGATTEGNVCFEIPNVETDLRLLYEYDWHEYLVLAVQ